LTPHLLELLVRLGAWLPFAPVAELLVHVGGNTRPVSMVYYLP
jgi:hypothetical protein